MTASLQGDEIVLTPSSGSERIRLRAALENFAEGQYSSRQDTFLVPALYLQQLLVAFPDLHVAGSEDLLSTLHAQDVALSNARESFDKNESSLVIGDWVGYLDEHQIRAVNALVTPNLSGGCLFDEQGTGKTIMTIAAFDILRERTEIEQMIVVSPKSMLGSWHADICKCLADKYRVGIIEGDQKKKREVALDENDVYVVNYEGVSSVLTVLQTIARQRKTLLAVDESFFAKNPNAQRSQNVGRLRPFCQRCFVLCGTPAANSPYDVINQADLADGGRAFAGFRKTSDVVQDRERIRKVLDDKSLTIRRLKQDVMPNLPPKIFHVVSVEMPIKQRAMYEKARDSLVLELKTYDAKKFRKSLATYFQKRSVLLQLCSAPSMVDPTFTDPPAKLDKLDALVSELVGQNRKVIVWTFYKESIRLLVEHFANLSPLVIDGETADKTAVVNAFQNDATRMMLIANPGAAGAGLTLHASHDAIYYSYTNKAADYLQSLDRIHRRGQKSAEVSYYLFVCARTIEENEVLRLRQRELQQHDVLGDTVVFPESLDDALAELTGG